MKVYVEKDYVVTKKELRINYIFPQQLYFKTALFSIDEQSELLI